MYKTADNNVYVSDQGRLNTTTIFNASSKLLHHKVSKMASEYSKSVELQCHCKIKINK